VIQLQHSATQSGAQPAPNQTSLRTGLALRTSNYISMTDLVRVGSLGKGGVRGVAKQVKVERPRPLKIGGGAHPELSLEDLLVEIERFRKSLGVKGEGGGDQIVGQLQLLAANLKISGPTLEVSHKDQMDKLNHSLMTACRAESLDLVARVHMLELIELRTMGWQPNENVTNYYKQKLAQIEYESSMGSSAKSQTAPVSLNPTAPDFNPFSKSFDSKLSTSQNKKTTTELKSDMTKFVNIKPRNSRVSSTGDSHADLPSPSSNPSKSETHECVVKIGNDELKVSGVSLDLVKTAKIVLHEFFNICNPEDAIMESPPPELDEKNFGARRKNMSGGSNKSTDSEGGTIALVKPEISYAKQELMAMSKSPLCKMAPSTWSEVTKDLPGVVRRADRAGPTSKIIQREMEGLRKQEEAKNV